MGPETSEILITGQRQEQLRGKTQKPLGASFQQSGLEQLSQIGKSLLMTEAHDIRTMETRRVCGKGGMGALDEAPSVIVKRLRETLMTRAHTGGLHWGVA